MRIFTLPNFITLANLLCGCLGIYFVFQAEAEWASYLLFSALLLDFCDGFLARALNSSSEIGKELDSLADVVSFGVLPAFMLFKMLENSEQLFEYQQFTAFCVALASALRLAKFNVDTRQTDSFIGVPTPANGMVVASWAFVLSDQLLGAELFQNTYFILAYILLISILLNAELPLLALKFKDFNWVKNKFRFILIGLSVVLILALKWAAFFSILLIYILLSIISRRFS
jgi:CDP-diacylglycerol---serine O-phosphatidyltransferase